MDRKTKRLILTEHEKMLHEYNSEQMWEKLPQLFDILNIKYTIPIFISIQARKACLSVIEGIFYTKEYNGNNLTDQHKDIIIASLFVDAGLTVTDNNKIYNNSTRSYDELSKLNNDIRKYLRMLTTYTNTTIPSKYPDRRELHDLGMYLFFKNKELQSRDLISGLPFYMITDIMKYHKFYNRRLNMIKFEIDSRSVTK